MLAEEVARRLGTINYEVTCGALPRVPRAHRPRRVAGVSAGDAARRSRARALAGRAGVARRRRGARPAARPRRRWPTSTSSSPATRGPAARRCARAARRRAAFALSDDVRRLARRRAGRRVAGRPRAAAGRRRSTRTSRARDLTVNAIAEPLAGGDLVDPHGGAADLAARRAADGRPRRVRPTTRCASLRVARLAPRARLRARAARPRRPRAHARRRLAGVAGERVFAELRALVARRRRARRPARCSTTSAPPASSCPSSTRCAASSRRVYHHLDVHGHTLEVLEAAIALERDPGPSSAREPGRRRVRALLARAAGRRPDARRRAALGRAAARRRQAADRGPHAGRRRRRLPRPRPRRAPSWRARSSAAPAGQRAAARARRGARPATTCGSGFLVHERPARPPGGPPLPRRHRARVEADVTLLSVADRLATRGRKAEEAIARPPGASRADLLDAALALAAGGPPPPLVRGDELAGELGIAPGPAARARCSRASRRRSTRARSRRADEAVAARAPSPERRRGRPIATGRGAARRVAEPRRLGDGLVVDVRGRCRSASGSWPAAL